MVAHRVRVHGVVQGVGFRWSLATEARRHGVAGWVRNRSDGSVEAHLEGDGAGLAAVEAWCHEGPRFARVSRVEVEVAQPTGTVIFDVEP